MYIEMLLKGTDFRSFDFMVSRIGPIAPLLLPGGLNQLVSHYELHGDIILNKHEEYIAFVWNLMKNHLIK